MNSFKSQSFSSELLGERYTKYTHRCGLDVYIFHKDMSATYALFGVKYGSVNNSFKTDDGEMITVPDGIAHFLEHKLFFNEDGSDSFERFSEYGADANAYTSFNKTAYLFSCTDGLDRSLGELIDFVTHPYFTPESVAAEIGIISEEIKMYDDSPSDRCFYGMLEGMYEHHSIRRNICGSEKTIRQISAKTLYDCYNAFYRPENMALIICGSVNDDEVLAVCDSHLPKDFLGNGVDKINENADETKSSYRSYVEQELQVSKPMFNIGFKDTDIPSLANERQHKDAVMAILDEMLFSRSGELYNSLFDRGLISPALSYGYTISETFAYNSVAGEADDPSAVLDEIMDYVGKVRKNGLDRESFDRAKKVMFAEWIKSFDSVEGIANSLFSFVSEGAEILGYTDILTGVSFEDVQAAFDASFAKDTVTLSVVKPIKNNEK